jgi:hypothetical protein
MSHKKETHNKKKNTSQEQTMIYRSCRLCLFVLFMIKLIGFYGNKMKQSHKTTKGIYIFHSRQSPSTTLDVLIQKSQTRH